MATVLAEAFRRLEAEIERVDREIDTLPWYRFLKRQSLQHEWRTFNARRIHLRAEQQFPESSNNDSFMIRLQEEYTLSRPSQQFILHTIVHGNQ